MYLHCADVQPEIKKKSNYYGRDIVTIELNLLSN